MQVQVEEFLHRLVEEKGASPHTIVAYRNDLGQFLGWLAGWDVGSWQEVGREHVSNFVLWLGEQGYAASTVARKLAAVKSFFHSLVAQGVVRDDPTATVESPRVERPSPTYLSLEEIERLLEYCGRGTTPKVLRDRALLELMCATGMRVSEVVALSVDDVDLGRGEVRCVSRGGRERTVSLTARALEALRTYVEEGRPALAAQDEEALFVNLRGRALTRQGLWLLVRQWAQRAGIGREVTPHVLRHSFAVHRLRQGDSLEEVQQLLGHANLSTTRLYVRCSPEGGT